MRKNNEMKSITLPKTTEQNKQKKNARREQNEERTTREQKERRDHCETGCKENEQGARKKKRPEVENGKNDIGRLDK